MSPDITIWNLHGDYQRGDFPTRFEFIGRPSVLGNPFVIGEPNPYGQVRAGRVNEPMLRDHAVQNYRRWLFDILRDGLAGNLSQVSEEQILDLEKQWTRPRRARMALAEQVQDPWRRAAVWLKVNALLHRWQDPLEPGDLNLVCYCAPLACHGDVLANALRWLQTRVVEEPGGTPGARS